VTDTTLETPESNRVCFDGTWTVNIATPIGKQQVVFWICSRAGCLEGTATQGSETVPFLDAVADGPRLTWSQRVTKPLRLTIAFDVRVDGDSMSGVAKAGVFPASKLEGRRTGAT
jgi:hypothetical protein